jgi:hypothetical protein
MQHISDAIRRSFKLLQQRQFGTSATCAVMLPVAADPDYRTMVIGFADGCVRVVKRCSDGWCLLDASRPFTVGQTQLVHVHNWQGCMPS